MMKITSSGPTLKISKAIHVLSILVCTPNMIMVSLIYSEF